MKLRAMLLVAAMTVALVGSGLVTQEPAGAHDHLIPKTVLMKGAKELQPGRLVVDSSWTRPVGGGEFVTQTAVYSWRWPEVDRLGVPVGDRVAPESKLRVRIYKEEQPDTFSVTAYPKVVQNGDYWEPSGQGRLLGSSFKPIVRDGRTVAWDAIFYVNRPDRDYYLVTEGHWRDLQGSGEDQWAHWSFYVKTASSS